MNSLGADCNELKKSYDSCFNVWFAEKFLKGDRSDDMCKPIFLVYQECVKNAIKGQNIDFKEVNREILGSSEEKKTPEEAPAPKTEGAK